MGSGEPEIRLIRASLRSIGLIVILATNQLVYFERVFCTSLVDWHIKMILSGLSITLNH